jgi:AcrR family transcriptional regulator
VTPTDTYHHGDLPNALRRAAASVIDERGLGAFSLREVARRADVSHNAPAHHFGDVRGLLTSLAREGFEALYDAAQAAVRSQDDTVEQLMAIGEAYVALARSHPAHCELMFRVDIIDTTNPGLLAAGRAAYGVLEDAVARVIAAEGLDADLDRATWLCWSAMQGLVTLEPKIALLNRAKGGADVSTRELVRHFTQLIVDGLRHANSG